ncbi:hypothetical protein JB92DRAFT_335155 [Gautieria morchelliformis]|nr:hypothetical protein JB92DRAFT_335155 [Gautieria morchelliformis]
MAPSQFLPPSGASAISLAPRRPSAILSSLHRPSFPLKLDLSPAALAAGNVDPLTMGQPMDVNVDLGLTSLPSPVTLAPKTARALPNDPSIPDIFNVGSAQGIPSNVPDGSGPSESGSIPGNVGMKTTVTEQEDVIDLTGPEHSRGATTQLGDSADKPIELDLEGTYDDMDLFGDVQTGADTANATNVTSQVSDATVASAQLDVDMDGLFTPQDNQTNTFQLNEAMQSGHAGGAPDPDILASLGSNTGTEKPNELSSLLPGQSVNNPGQSLPDNMSGDSFPELGSSAESQFDLASIDLSSFTGLFDGPGDAEATQSAVGGDDDMDLMQLLAMDETQAVNPSGGDGDNGR